MHQEDSMDFSERRKYLRILRQRYRKASRREKSLLLDEMVAVTGLDRKTIIRQMGGDISLERKPREKERGLIYGPDVRAAVSLVAQALDDPAAERLQPVLATTAALLTARRTGRG